VGRRRREREGVRLRRGGESEHALTAFCSPSLDLLISCQKISSEKNSSTTKTLYAISDSQTQTTCSSQHNPLQSEINAQICLFLASILATLESQYNSLSTLHLAVGESLGLLGRRVAYRVEEFAKSLIVASIPAGPKLIPPPEGSLFPQGQIRPRTRQRNRSRRSRRRLPRCRTRLDNRSKVCLFSSPSTYLFTFISELARVNDSYAYHLLRPRALPPSIFA